MNNVIPGIVFSKLVSGCPVFLPGVGTLGVERDPAKFVSGKEIRPPHRRVVYSHHRGSMSESVVDILARDENVGPYNAAAYYSEWSDEARGQQGFMEIHGVGVIKNDIFYPSVELHERLNPQGDKTIVLKKYNSGAGKFLMAAAAAFLLGAVIFLVGSMCRGCGDGVRSRRLAEKIAEDTRGRYADDRDGWDGWDSWEEEPEEDVADDGDSRAKDGGASVVAGKDDRTQLSGTQSSGVSASRPAVPVYCVVAGVFDVKQNAEKCVRQDPLRIGSANYKIYPYKDGKYLVSAYESADKAAADTSRRELSKYKSDIWVYAKK